MSEKHRIRRPPSNRYLEIFTLVEIQGRPHDDVALECGITVRSVRDVCSRVRSWMRKYGGKWDKIAEREKRALIAREVYVARLEFQWQQAMNAWHRSTKERQTKKSVHERGQPSRKVELTTHTQTGDVRYLIQARAILASLRDMWSNRSNANKEQVYEKLSSIKRREEACDQALAEVGYSGGASPDAGEAGRGIGPAHAA